MNAGGRGAACRKRGRVRKIGIVEFEFDPWKSESNKAKHGIDFVDAQALWKSKVVLLSAKDALEKRYLVIGTIEGRKSTAAETDTYEKIAG